MAKFDCKTAKKNLAALEKEIATLVKALARVRAKRDALVEKIDANCP